MDVFLRHLPADLTDQGLKAELVNSIETLNIRDWTCEKPRKKTFGFITFLNVDEGERFLRQYQPLKFSESYAGTGLVILGTQIFCQRSKRPLDKYLLKSMTKSAEERRHTKRDSRQARNEKLVFHTRSLSCGYYDYANDKLFYSPETQWESIRGLAKFAKHILIIEFESHSGKRRIEIPYRIVEAMVISRQNSSFTLTLWEAPRFFGVGTTSTFEAMASLSIQQKPPTSRSRLTGLSDSTFDHRQVFGLSLVYKVYVLPDEFEEMERRLRERNILPIYRYNVSTPPMHERRSLANGLEELRKSIQKWVKIIPFGLLYQAEALVKNGYLLPWAVQSLLTNIVKAAVSAGANSTSKNFPVSPGAVRKLFSQIPFPGFEVEASNFKGNEIWELIQKNEKDLQDSAREILTGQGHQNSIMVHRVNVTPTRITLHGPDSEAKNRILRRFSIHSDYFIRVQFRDEDGTGLRFNSNVSNGEIYQRFKGVFEDGISIGGRVFKFLGFSHSSLRGHSVWLMAPFFHNEEFQTYFSVISRLGKFDNIYSPARCAARIGQAFSETPLAISLSQNDIEYTQIPDVVSKDGSRIFSDGTGTISRPVMEAIQKVAPQGKSAPTCFQIRWAGAKGMLSLDPRLEGNTMCIRSSMTKFESTDSENLEICDIASKPIRLVLNRQMIKILEDMGVSPDWFLQQQSRELLRLKCVTADIKNTVRYLKRQNIAHRVRFPQLLSRLNSMGIDYRSDQFLSAVVEVAILRELRLLKHKAKIPIEQGVTLFGTMDETGYLEEGHIYAAFDDADFIRGHSLDLDNYPIVITRSPALHPGDVQLARNTVPPDHHPLRVLRNCIVFSQKGTRDLPSCLSGGDLDGDTYSIIWDKDVVSQCRAFEPADYPRVEPLSINREVKQEDMTNFFIQFMETDQLGLIAVKHMILADQRDNGTDDQDCKTLAKLHSTGVDYSKTGRPVDMSEVKNIRMNRYRPDFLAPAPPASIKNRTEISFDASIDASPDEIVDEDDMTGPIYQYYKSDRINGKLYRAVDEKKIWDENIRASVDPKVDVWGEFLKAIKSECDENLGTIYWAEVEQEAWGICSAYEDAVRYATLDYSDHATMRISELEVFTGAIFNKSGVQTQRQRDRSLRLKDEFDRIVKSTEAMIRKPKMKAQENRIEEDQFPTGSKEGLARSIACLNVGCARKQSKASSARRSGGDFQSFRVVAACCVIKELNFAINDRNEQIGGTSRRGHTFTGIDKH